jgi:pimeloyl-ACP methyl ester carboxylesterase
MKTLIVNRWQKAAAVLSAFLFIGILAHAQDITGSWHGAVNFQGVTLRIVFHISKTDDGYKSTMDSPDQNVKGIPVNTTKFDGSKLSLAIPAIGLSYEGDYQTDSIAGILKQGASLPMTLKREQPVAKPQAAQPLNRPQEPKPPYPYRSEDVAFENKSAGITLAGTLTMPAQGSDFTAVVLISGSGLQNRDSEIFGHKPFLVIADYLTRQGIAVLRYDDRGFAQSTGDPRTATSADFAADAESAIAFLKTRKEINPRKIGLAGHSEGGTIASIIAAQSKDVDFIVMLAGTGKRGDAVLLQQNELIARAMGMSEDMIAKNRIINSKVFNIIVDAKGPLSQQEISEQLKATLMDDLAALFPEKTALDAFIKTTSATISSPWMQYFLRYDPVPALEQVKCPVLALNGSNDLQVGAKENLSAISEALKKGGNKNVTIKEYPDLNHLFQECTTGLPAEYEIIEQTISPEVLKDVAGWILNNYKL